MRSESANFFMYKKITNNKIYDLANYLISEDTYRIVNIKPGAEGARCMPVLNTENIRELIKINDDFEFIGDYGRVKEIKDVNDSFYKMLFQDGEESSEIAKYHFFDHKLQNRFEQLIRGQVKKIINDFHVRGIPLKEIDNKNEEVNKLIDGSINEFADFIELYY